MARESARAADVESYGLDPWEPRHVLLGDLTPDWIAAELARAVSAGTPPKAAAQYLVGWIGSALGEVVGAGLVEAGAGWLFDEVAFTLHPDGWPAALACIPRAVVEPGHRWAGLAGVDVLTHADADAGADADADAGAGADADAGAGADAGDTVAARAVRALVEVITPFVDAVAAVARVGRIGLWNEIGDSITGVLAYKPGLAHAAAKREVLLAAVTFEGAPWRALPRVDVLDHDTLGTVVAYRRGGCCLAYTEAGPEPARPSEEPDAYCLTCSKIDFEVCARRQLDYLIEEQRSD